ncbi:hypothetical protein IFR05_012980 [Cadophora sp. M221]|nr:hypothetical protein IFR05_012980 [Cadophora sp. M221]
MEPGDKNTSPSISPLPHPDQAELQHVENITRRRPRDQLETADPLTWKFWVRIGITVNICANAFLNNVNAAGMVPTLVPIAIQFMVPITKAAQIQSYNVLAQGLGNMIWVPCMLKFGKRWTIIASSILFIPCIAWCATAKTFDSLLAGRILTGFASGASESFAPVIISDIWYEHNFTTAMGFFSLCILAGVGVGQVSIGYITQSIGWRWAHWVTFIAAALNLVTMILWLPETTYQRHLVVGTTAGDIQRHRITTSKPGEGDVEDGAMQRVETSSMPTTMKENLWFVRHAHVDYGNNWFATFFRPFRFFLSPVVFWSALTYAVLAGAFTAAGVCVPQMFGPPPYSFNSGEQGLFGLAALVGVLIGGTIGSKAVDIVNNRREHKRFETGKEHKPEERLLMLILPFCTATTGLVMYGITIERQLPWIAPAVAYAMLGFGFTTMGGITISYNLDAFLVRSGEVSVFNNINRALISFALADVAPEWLLSAGPGKVFSILAGVLGGLLLLGIPAFVFGPRMRAATNRFI